VSLCPLKIVFLFTRTVLVFFIAGLLFLCLEHVKHWERIASRRRPAFSSHLVSSGNRTSGFGPVSTSPVTAVYRDLGMNVNADEKLNFRANWTIRGATLVQEIRPNVGEVNSKSGSQNCG